MQGNSVNVFKGRFDRGFVLFPLLNHPYIAYL
jgi:hypothetical protein